MRINKMSFEHNKELMIGKLQLMKEMINQTILLIDNANDDEEMLRALIDSPLSKDDFNDFKLKK